MNSHPLVRPDLKRHDYLYVAGAWFLVSFIPFLWLTSGTYFHWEPTEVAKMLDYGFWERKGAMLSPGWRVGLLQNPEAHNYVNHNYPIIWLYSLLYWLFGKAGMYALVALRSLATALLTFGFLSRVFPRTVAMFASFMAIASYGMIEFTMNTDVIGQGVIIWPLAGLLAFNLEANPLRKKAIFLGVAIFCAGQITWFALSVTPALLMLCLSEKTSFPSAISRLWKHPGCLPLIVGAAASGAVFICQILAYTPTVSGNADYLKLQMGLVSGEAASRLSMFPVLLLRMLVAAPALWFGAIVGTILCMRDSQYGRFARVSGVYFLTFCAITFCIPRLLFLNQHGFSYMVFPCAIMTGFALAKTSSKSCRVALVGISAVGLLICYAKLHDYRASNAALTFGDWLGKHTQKNELVFSNYKHTNANHPVQDWDYEFFAEASVIADRLLYKEVSSIDAAKKIIAQVGNHPYPMSYLHFVNVPSNPNFLQKLLTEKTEVIEANIEIPPESPRVFKLLRQWLWQSLPGSTPFQSSEGNAGSTTNRMLKIQLIRLPSTFPDTNDQ